jgi:hypothetical protein
LDGGFNSRVTLGAVGALWRSPSCRFHSARVCIRVVKERTTNQFKRGFNDHPNNETRFFETMRFFIRRGVTYRLWRCPNINSRAHEPAFANQYVTTNCNANANEYACANKYDNANSDAYRI